MSDWFASVAGEQYAAAIMWTVGALILLAVVLLIVRLLRSFGSGTFVAGGRNRRPRLAVADAATVDNNRRLVLVRRDDVEHLLLVGGPTDIVVEQNIRPLAPRPQAGPDEAARQQPQRPKTAAVPATAVTTAGAATAQMPAEPVPPVPPVVTAARQPAAAQPITDPIPEPAREVPAPEPRAQTPAPSRQHEPTMQQASTAQHTPAASVAPPPAAAQAAPAGNNHQEQASEAGAELPDRTRDAERASLEDEMTRLLEDISDDRR